MADIGRPVTTTDQPKPAKQVEIFDTTLRDGEQTPGVGLSVREKLEIAEQLVRLRVDIIEAGFPISSPGDFEAVRAVSRAVQGSGVTVCGLARTRQEDIDRSWEAIRDSERPRIHIFIATSPVHMKHKLRLTEDEVLQAAEDMTRYAASTGAEVEFSAEDATRSEPEFVRQVFRRAAAAGAHVLNVPDTVGYTTPAEYKTLLEFLMADIMPAHPKVKFSVHCHNDLGLAVANSMTAVTVGVTQIECTINGLGERAGNTSMEEVVMGLYTRRSYYQTNCCIDTRQIARSSRLVTTLTGIPVQPNKAIVGTNAFAHQSGIHQDGVLKQPLTYEIMRPEDVGLAGSALVLGKLSGRHAFRQRLAEMGYTLTPARLDRVFARFKELADRKRDITQRDLEALLEDEVVDGPETISLESFHVVAGNGAIPTATVRVRVGSETKQEACLGTGPVDAVFRALARAIGLGDEAGLKLADYSLKAVTSGEDALGEATLRLEMGGRTALGRGVSTDVIEASALAYVKALNRLLGSAESSRPTAAEGGASGGAVSDAGRLERGTAPE